MARRRRPFSHSSEASRRACVAFWSRLNINIEGVGALTALTFVLTLEDPCRFAKSRTVGAYSLGLVPATDQSGDRDPHEKRISKEGDEMLSVGFWWAALTTSWVPSDRIRT